MRCCKDFLRVQMLSPESDIYLYSPLQCAEYALEHCAEKKGHLDEVVAMLRAGVAGDGSSDQDGADANSEQEGAPPVEEEPDGIGF